MSIFISSSMLCASKIHPFSLGNYLGTSLTIGNLMKIRVIGAEWTQLGLEWPPAQYVAKHPASLLHSFLLENSLYFGVNEIISFQKLVGSFDKMAVAKLGLATPEIFGLLFQEFLRMVVFVWSYKLLFHTIHIAQTPCIYIYIQLILLMFMYILDNTTILPHLSY